MTSPSTWYLLIVWVQQDLSKEGRIKAEANLHNYFAMCSLLEISGSGIFKASVLSLCSKVANESALLKQGGLIAIKSMSAVTLQGVSFGGKNGFILKYFAF